MPRKKRNNEEEDKYLSNKKAKTQLGEDLSPTSSQEILLNISPTKIGVTRSDNIADNIIDNLARLIQMTSQGCSCVSFINNKIFITDNNMPKNKLKRGKNNKDPERNEEKETIGKIELIESLLEYFGSIQTFKPIDIKKEDREDYLPKNREKIFAEACIKRVLGEEKGQIKLEPAAIRKIAIEILNDPNESIDNITGGGLSGKPKKYKPDKIYHIPHACSIITQLKYDFKKIERYLQNKGNQNQPLTKAFRNNKKIGRIDIAYYPAQADLQTPVPNVEQTQTPDEIGEKKTRASTRPASKAATQNIIQQANTPPNEVPLISLRDYNIANDNSYGRYIVFVDKGLKEKLHAEVQMTDFLLITDILQNSKESIYLGISKLCCAGCAKTIDALNLYKNNQIKTIEDEAVLTNLVEHIKKRGTHGLDFSDSESYTPAIILDDELVKQIGSRCYVGTNNKIIQQPQQSQLTNLKEELKKINRKHKGGQVYITQDIEAAKTIQKFFYTIKDFPPLEKNTPLTDFSESEFTPKKNTQTHTTSTGARSNPALLNNVFDEILNNCKNDSAVYNVMINAMHTYNDFLRSQSGPTKNIAVDLFGAASPIQNSDWFVEKMRASDNKDSSFCILLSDDGKNFDRKTQVVSRLQDAIDGGQNNAVLTKYIVNDLYDCYQTAISNTQFMHQLPKNMQKYFESLALKQTDPGLIFSEKQFVESIAQDKTAIKDYLEYFGNSERAPSPDGILAALAEVQDKKIHCWNIQEQTESEVKLKSQFTNQKQGDQSSDKIIHLVYNKTKKRFEELKGDLITTNDAVLNNIRIANPNIQQLSTPSLISSTHSPTPHLPSSPNNFSSFLATGLSQEEKTALNQHANPAKPEQAEGRHTSRITRASAKSKSVPYKN